MKMNQRFLLEIFLLKYDVQLKYPEIFLRNKHSSIWEKSLKGTPQLSFSINP